MDLSYKIYFACWFVGLKLITLWNLNHTFEWTKDMDFAYGIGIALIIFGGAFYAYVKSNNRVKRIISLFFLYIASSNLSDEILFDPYVVNWYEYLTAIITLPLIISYVNRIEKSRD